MSLIQEIVIFIRCEIRLSRCLATKGLTVKNLLQIIKTAGDTLIARAVQHDNRVLIIDAKYYEHSTQVQFDKHTLHSNNLYQIFTYVKNKEYELREKDHTVSGMLLYAKTDEEIYPNNVYQMSGNQITVRTLDLNLPFDEIAGQLNTIAKTHFDL